MASEQQQQLHIGIILFDDFEELDTVGPLEVFGVSDKLRACSDTNLNDNDDTTTTTNAATNTNANTNANTTTTTTRTLRYKVVTVAVPGNPGDRRVRGAHGMLAVADYAADDPSSPPLPALDVVLAPGGEGAHRLGKDRAVTDWLAALCERATWTTSVCTGAFLLHAAGCVAGKRVATHFMFEDKLQALEGGVVVVRDQRWGVDGLLVTSQGISAGIDMSLWLIGQLHSPEHARETQQIMQYGPAPPYNARGEEAACTN